MKKQPHPNRPNQATMDGLQMALGNKPGAVPILGGHKWVYATRWKNAVALYRKKTRKHGKPGKPGRFTPPSRRA